MCMHLHTYFKAVVRKSKILSKKIAGAENHFYVFNIHFYHQRYFLLRAMSWVRSGFATRCARSRPATVCNYIVIKDLFYRGTNNSNKKLQRVSISMNSKSTSFQKFVLLGDLRLIHLIPYTFIIPACNLSSSDKNCILTTIVFGIPCQKAVCQQFNTKDMSSSTDYGRPMKPFFIEIPNFCA